MSQDAISLLKDKEKEKEKNLWMQHIQKIAQIGPQNVNLFDTYKGEILAGNGKILLDKSILEKINFIKEGRFAESNKDGLPTLKLVGEIEGIVEQRMSIPTDKLYPLFTKDLLERLSINSHDIRCILWKLNLKGNRKFHTEISSGKNSNSIHKYSESIVPFLKRKLNGSDFLEQCKQEFKKSNLNKNKK
jgi:hypothetical protein